MQGDCSTARRWIARATRWQLPLEPFSNEAACLALRIAMDIGCRNAYKRLVPQRGSDHRGVKSHGEETQEGQENRSEKVTQVQSLPQVVVTSGGHCQAASAPESVTRITKGCRHTAGSPFFARAGLLPLMLLRQIRKSTPRKIPSRTSTFKNLTKIMRDSESAALSGHSMTNCI